MEANQSSGNPLRFSSFEVDLRTGELRKHGIRVKLQDQPFQILVSLLEKPGDVVTREELRERLWPADTFVDFDHSLNSAVKKLRQALNDDPDVPRFIETLPRRGYRFIAPLRNGESSSSDATAQGISNERESLPSAMAVPAVATPLRHWKLWAAGAAGFALALGLVGWFGFSRTPSAPSAPIRLVPLTTYSGEQSKPSFSPDGNQVAFAWEGEGQRNQVNLFIKQIGIEKPLQITHDFGFNFLPSWSPDGRYIAFFHADRNVPPGIYLMPALGGPARKLRNIEPGMDCKPDLSWSPDTKFLVFNEKPSPNEPCTLFSLSLEDLQTRKLTSPPVPSVGDWAGEYSPDGRSIAFIRNTKDVEDIYVMPAAGGEPRRVTFDNRLMSGLAWTPDSKELVFSSNRGGSTWGLWRVPAKGGTSERVAVGSDRAWAPVLSMKGRRLAYATGGWNENIWRVAIGAGNVANATLVKFISSTLQEEGPQYSPDGTRIAFQSTRSGSFEIYRADADGSNIVQLTSFGGPLTGSPRWSPDGKWIAFDSRPGTHPNVHVVSAEGGPVRRFTNDTSDDGVASWSHDGRWIYFASDRTGKWQVWKMPSDGSGQPVQITRNGGFATFESPDSKVLYYTKYDDAGVWSVPVQGGEETKILDFPPRGHWGYFAVTTKGIYFLAPDNVRPNEARRPVVNLYDFVTHKITQVGGWAKDKGPYERAPGMSASPDDRWLLIVQLDEARDNLMLAENFR